jgi:hypothetical protein
MSREIPDSLSPRERLIDAARIELSSRISSPFESITRTRHHEPDAVIPEEVTAA